MEGIPNTDPRWDNMGYPIPAFPGNWWELPSWDKMGYPIPDKWREFPTRIPDGTIWDIPSQLSQVIGGNCQVGTRWDIPSQINGGNSQHGSQMGQYGISHPSFPR